jgi:hypothetical protein
MAQVILYSIILQTNYKNCTYFAGDGTWQYFKMLFPRFTRTAAVLQKRITRRDVPVAAEKNLLLLQP